MDVYEEGTDNPLSEQQLLHQLNHIVDSSRFEDDFPVGIMTCEDRNVWAQGYKRLTRGFFSVCLFFNDYRQTLIFYQCAHCGQINGMILSD